MNTISYNFGIATLSRLILGGISLVIVGFLTRYLGPAGYGNYSLILAYLYIFTALADLGLNTMLVREISREGADEKKISDNIFTLRLALTIGFVLVGVVLVFFLDYPFEVKIGVALASIFSIFSSLSQVLVGIFQKHLCLYYISLADVVSRTLQLVLIVVLAKMHPSLTAFVWTIVISEVARFSLVFYFSRKLVSVNLAFDFKYWLETAKTALPIAVSLVFVLLYFKMDTVLLSLMKPSHDVGVYSVAYKILETVIFLPALYIGLVMPILSRYAFGDRKKFISYFKKSFNIMVIFALPAMAYIYLRASDIINIISGPGYEQSITVLKVLSIAIMLIFFGNLAGNALVALNLQKKGIWVYFIGAVLNVGANLILIPRFSYMATAWTTVMTEFIITTLLFWLIKKQSQVSVEYKIALKAILVTIIMAVGLNSLHLEFIPFTVLFLLYFPILYFFRGFDLNDLKLIISAKPGAEVTD